MRLLKLWVVLILCLSLPIVSYAHPGRTDSKGGHTNHSTGEYHYHHGKPEHQHYDYDGDGVLDCPYDFDGKTETSESSESSKSDASEKTKNAIKDYFTPIIGCFVLYGVVLLFDEIKWRFRK